MFLLAAGGLKTEQLLFTVLIQLLLIVAAARVFATVFRWFRQPVVVGEIAAGIFLGPSCFGYFFPETSRMIFDPSVSDVFGVLSQLGLILLLFVVGLEFDFSHLRFQSRAAATISLTGIALPFVLGFCLASAMYPFLEDIPADRPIPVGGFALFMGIAMSITAIPILGRLMMELNITRTKIGVVTISAAAVDDACGWILLATVSSMVQAQYDIWLTVRMVAATLVFFAVAIFVIRPVLKRLVRRALAAGHGELGMNTLAVVYGTLFVCALATNLIGIFAIFGAFTLGTVLSDEHEFRDVMRRHLRDLLGGALPADLLHVHRSADRPRDAAHTAAMAVLCGRALLCRIGQARRLRLRRSIQRLHAPRGALHRHDDEHPRVDGVDRHQRGPRPGRGARQRVLHAGPDGSGHHHHDHAALAALHARHGTRTVHSRKRVPQEKAPGVGGVVIREVRRGSKGRSESTATGASRHSSPKRERGTRSIAASSSLTLRVSIRRCERSRSIVSE